MSGQFWLTGEQVERLRPHFPKARGKPRVDDRRVLSEILHVLRNGLRWQDAPAVYGPHKTLLSYESGRLLRQKGATACHAIHGGQWRGSDRKTLGRVWRRVVVGSPLSSSAVLNGYPGSRPG